MATVAVFIALGGGAYALSNKAPKDSVNSRAIVNGSVKSKDVKDNSLTGTDIDQSTLSGGGGGGGSPTGPAGGDLQGNYPKPQIAQGAVGQNALNDGSVIGAKLGKIVTVSTTVDLPAGTRREGTASCPNGTVLLSGGANANPGSPPPWIDATFPNNNGWYARAYNGQTFSGTLVVFANCLQ